MIARTCVALGVLFVAACGTQAGPTPAEPAHPADSAGPLDALNRRHSRLRSRMRRRGYAERVGLSRVFVPEAEGVALPYDLVTAKCSTFVALGGGSLREVVLTLYDGEGELSASDSIEGEGGLLHVCPQPAQPGDASRPYYLVIEARVGSGAVLLAHFRSEPGEGEGFDGLFDGVLAPPVQFRGLEEQLARVGSALRARGLSQVGEPRVRRLTEGSAMRATVDMEPNHCYIVIGRGGDAVQDIDLFLYDPAGVEVSRDLGTDAEPSIQHCPEMRGQHIVELRAFDGAGPVGALVYSGTERTQETQADPAGIDTVNDPAVDGAEPENALRVLMAPLEVRGFDPPAFVVRNAPIAPGELRSHEVVLGPGCALIAGAASHDAMDLDLYLTDLSGREFDRDTAVESTARVRACSNQTIVMRVTAKAYGRDGAYALAVVGAPAAVSSMTQLRLEEATAPFRSRGYEEGARSTQRLRRRQSLQRQLRVASGECIAVVAAGDSSVRDVDLFMRGASGALVARDSGPAPHAVVSRCAETEETLSLSLVMYRGGGDVTLQILTRGHSEPRDHGDALAP